jgi:O-antigen ligase
VRATLDPPPALTLDRARALALTGAAAVFAYLAAQRLLRGGLMVGLLVLAIGLAVLVLERPRATVALMLVFSAPLAEPMRRLYYVGGLTTDAFEVLAYALILRWVISRGREARTPSWRFAGPLVLLVGGATVGAAYGLYRGADHTLVLGQFKSYLVYLLVLPLTALFTTTRDKARLERWVVTFCIAGSLVVLGAAAIGSSTPSEAPNIPINTFGVTTQVNRIRPAMLWLLFLATLIVLGKVFAYGMSRRRGAALALFLGVWLFSFNRSSWAALVVCAGVLALLRPGPRRPGRGIRTAAVAALLLPLFLALAASGTLGPSLRQVPARLDSLVNPQVVSEDAVQDRASEYPFAFNALRHSPLLGVGLGRSYGARRPFYDPRLGVVVYEDRPFSHNSIVFAYLQTGLLGIAALGWLAVAAIRAAREALRTMPPDIALRVLTGCVALLGYGIQSLTQTSLLHRPGITAAVVAMVLATAPRDAPAPGPADA